MARITAITASGDTPEDPIAEISCWVTPVRAKK